MWGFPKQPKKFRLLPIIVITLMFGVLMVFARGFAIAPFIYNLVLISQDPMEGTGENGSS